MARIFASAAACQALLLMTCCVCALPPRDVPLRYPTKENSSGTVRHVGGGQRFMFPDEDTKASLAPSLDMSGKPPCATVSSTSLKATFCENVDDYPEAEIRRLIRFDKADFGNLFGPSSGVNSRRTIASDDISEESVCRHQPQTFFPKTAKNDQNYWRYVVNDVDYIQAVVAEVCVKEGKACSFVQNSLPAGHQSICRQRYSYKRLLAIDPDEKKTYMDSFPFPSCCSCYVKVPSIFERSSRGRMTTQGPKKN